jgi:hypothetical protein
MHYEFNLGITGETLVSAGPGAGTFLDKLMPTAGDAFSYRRTK